MSVQRVEVVAVIVTVSVVPLSFVSGFSRFTRCQHARHSFPWSWISLNVRCGVGRSLCQLQLVFRDVVLSKHTTPKLRRRGCYQVLSGRCRCQPVIQLPGIPWIIIRTKIRGQLILHLSWRHAGRALAEICCNTGNICLIWTAGAHVTTSNNITAWGTRSVLGNCSAGLPCAGANPDRERRDRPKKRKSQ